MKKALAVLVAIFLLFGVTACGETEPSSSSHAGVSSTFSYAEIEDESSEEEAPQPEAPAEWVYISRTGYCYHRLSYCSNMKDPLKVTRSEAVERGRKPCSNCY
jgi:hypothetical protein